MTNASRIAALKSEVAAAPHNTKAEIHAATTRAVDACRSSGGSAADCAEIQAAGDKLADNAPTP